MAVTPLIPASKSLQVKTETVARTDTAGKDLFVIPEGATLISVVVSGTTASDAGTSATLQVGDGSTADQFGTADVKANGATTTTTGSNMGALAATTKIVGTYVEAGTASTTGGPWTVSVFYTF